MMTEIQKDLLIDLVREILDLENQKKEIDERIKIVKNRAKVNNIIWSDVAKAITEIKEAMKVDDETTKRRQEYLWALVMSSSVVGKVKDGFLISNTQIKQEFPERSIMRLDTTTAKIAGPTKNNDLSYYDDIDMVMTTKRDTMSSPPSSHLMSDDMLSSEDAPSH